MFCKNCNADIPDDSVFCPSCGQKVEAEPVVAPAPAINFGFRQAGSLDGSDSGMGAPITERKPAPPQESSGLHFFPGFKRPGTIDLHPNGDSFGTPERAQTDNEREESPAVTEKTTAKHCSSCGAIMVGGGEICDQCIKKQKTWSIGLWFKSLWKEKKQVKIGVAACCILLVMVFGIICFVNGNGFGIHGETGQKDPDIIVSNPSEKYEPSVTIADPITDDDNHSVVNDEAVPAGDDVEKPTTPATTVKETAQILSDWYFSEFDRTDVVISILADVTHDGEDDLVIVLRNQGTYGVKGLICSVGNNGTVRMVEEAYKPFDDPMYPFGLYLKKADIGYNLIQERSNMFMGYGETTIIEYYLDANDNRIEVHRATHSAIYPNQATEESSNRFKQEGNVILDGASLICSCGPSTYFSEKAIKIDDGLIVEQKQTSE